MNKNTELLGVLLFSVMCNNLACVSKEMFSPYLSSDPVILEAGACNGRDTLEMAILWPEATIYAFEPHPHLFSILKSATENYSNIHCFELALSDVVGRTKFYVSGKACPFSSSLLSPRLDVMHRYWPDMTFEERDAVWVDTVTLDFWAKQEQIKKIDLMWLDMQGAELMMLKASPKSLNITGAIYLEVSFIAGYEGAPLYSEVRTWFENQGFNEVWNSWQGHPGAEGDVLFVRSH